MREHNMWKDEPTRVEDLPPVEVVTDKFRGVAKNFFSMPIGLIIALKESQYDRDGSDILILYDAAEMAFSEKDFDRLSEMSIFDFLKVVQAWVNYDKGGDDGTHTTA